MSSFLAQDIVIKRVGVIFAESTNPHTSVTEGMVTMTYCLAPRTLLLRMPRLIVC